MSIAVASGSNPEFYVHVSALFLLYSSYVQTSEGLCISEHKIWMREHSCYCCCTGISLEMHFHACISLRSFDLSPHPLLRFTVYTLGQLNHWYHGKLCSLVLWWTLLWDDALLEACRVFVSKSLLGCRKCLAYVKCRTDRSNKTNQFTVRTSGINLKHFKTEIYLNCMQSQLIPDRKHFIFITNTKKKNNNKKLINNIH